MDAFVGQLLLVPYNFVPAGWMLCQGQLVSISEYSTLFQLIGTTFGGDGVHTFGLPDLRGRTPLGMGVASTGTNYALGQPGGAEAVVLAVAHMPLHTHPASASATAGSGHPAGSLLGGGLDIYHHGSGAAAMNGATIGSLGGSLPHENRQPWLTLNWIISMYGIYPSQ